jgi:carboxyl-terminal processing protease
LSSSSSGSDISNFDFQLQKIISTWDIIYSGFVNRDEIDKSKLSDAAIEAMVGTLNDPYSVYLNQQENAAFSDDLDGEIEGIGAYIEVSEDGKIIIVSPIKDSPAEQAGIKPGDIIKKVDDKDIAGMNLYEAVNLIKGPVGTTVKLTIERNGATQVIEVVRDKIKISSIEYEVTDNGKAMVIKIAQFGQNTLSEFQDVAEIIQNNPQIKGIIIDVRDDPGGLLDSVVRIMYFLLKPESAIVTIKYNYFSHTQYAIGNGELAGYPMVVLINKGSASASEIMAGALKDLNVATIIGETSFGKGSVQELNYFSDNSGLKLTVAKWFTPLGNSIEKNGITPDITVTNDPNTENDEQMDRALTELNKLMR